MRGSGEAILEYLVKQADGAQGGPEIARAIGKRDARGVVQPIKHLEAAGLIQKTPGGLWYPTHRGREVDRLLDEVTVARGGTFQPLNSVGIAFTESYALRR